ncbi:Rossman fold protein, TIGR00730 family [Candidatus Gottesmanbacteria bacterium RIFCSPHIGHO2_02_FULL_40_13]|uniref:Cytokinin riboside 5'-monophosphate phosphoribohydrolase n=1 Tax=Candidatus Gottesmanbacteria bacterium RIFCSPHIGHO2_02_FULL_40_13 TaxID=1798384 RepID=A0A1F6A960_9BACT|nr:MAG: Rossman fold protein, TIGR00730 family [Candidatus Gottesmanbacteria bacterium RIFCSPHIGHO2_02_FULL_40_13]
MNKNIVVFAGNGCRQDKEEFYYSLSYETGKILAQSGFTAVTGGGPGLMNQVLKGAYENGGKTIGVRLHQEGKVQSPFVTRTFFYRRLKPRQAKLISLADAFLALPGGIGTFYEIFEVLSLKRKGEIKMSTPLIIIGSYFNEFLKLISLMEKEGLVHKSIRNLFDYCTDLKEMEKILQEVL